ncbi:MAG: translation initiation factor IF-2 [Nanoarchaeota archaeon]|nr:translation initiation factor IF-2 [Nanoarchaeota archaeon]
MAINNNIRSPIVTVVGHVDHGKTSLLDRFRGTSVQEGESGGITQKISFTRYPLEQLKKACPLLKERKISLEIPGLLFIDTPGHAAFTNLRKRGGSLADLAILVVAAKEGIKPQTAEVLQILRANKTPFLIAFNKIDSFSGWKRHSSLKESIQNQAINVQQEFQEALLTFQGSLQEHGFESDLYYEIKDFTKKIALVPCSAKTGEGISELLFVLAGLCEKFLKTQLKLSKEAKGVILEIKKEKSVESIESILYDGEIKEGDEIAVASFGDPIITKVKAIEEIESLSLKFKTVKSATAATGLHLHLTNKQGLLAGMLFQKIDNNLTSITESFKKQISQSIKTDPKGIIAKADSLGSLEALLFLLKQENISVVRAGIGPVNKTDIVAAKANLEIDALNAVIVGFNTELEEDLEIVKIKVLTNDVIYKLIEDLQLWRKEKQASIERERMLSLAAICKLEILHNFTFRNSNPAIFGVRVAGGHLKSGITLISDDGKDISRVKAIQMDKSSVNNAEEGKEVAISLPGVNFERQLADKKVLYSDIGESEFKKFKKNKDLLSSAELQALQEIADIKRRVKEDWGI